jgi:hypothetical protein
MAAIVAPVPKAKPGHGDPNEEAARVLCESTDRRDDLLSDIEGAWAAWSRRIQGVDERTRTLLRAAFEAGVEASRSSTPGSGVGSGTASPKR